MSVTTTQWKERELSSRMPSTDDKKVSFPTNALDRRKAEALRRLQVEDMRKRIEEMRNLEMDVGILKTECSFLRKVSNKMARQCEILQGITVDDRVLADTKKPRSMAPVRPARVPSACSRIREFTHAGLTIGQKHPDKRPHRRPSQRPKSAAAALISPNLRSDQARNLDDIRQGKWRSNKAGVYQKLRVDPDRESHRMHITHQMNRWKTVSHQEQMGQATVLQKQFAFITEVDVPVLPAARDCTAAMLRCRMMLVRPATAANRSRHNDTLEAAAESRGQGEGELMSNSPADKEGVCESAVMEAHYSADAGSRTTDGAAGVRAGDVKERSGASDVTARLGASDVTESSGASDVKGWLRVEDIAGLPERGTASSTGMYTGAAMCGLDVIQIPTVPTAPIPPPPALVKKRGNVAGSASGGGWQQGKWSRKHQ